MRKLLKDREELTTIVKENNPIWNWMVDAFNYPNNGHKIVWDKSSTSKNNPYGGECDFYLDADFCWIRVDDTYKSDFLQGVKRQREDVLECVVFELNNAHDIEDSFAASRDALAGHLSKNDFIIAVVKHEFDAENRTIQFYNKIWMPYCLAEHISYNSDLWPKTFPDFKSFLAQYPPGSDYPWKIYGQRYDNLMQRKSKDMTKKQGL